MSAAAGTGGGGMPRNFKLLEELEDAEKSAKGGADISLGLQRADDTFMSDWQASILAAAGGSSDVRIWFLTLHADEKYPSTAPTVKFTSKITMDCVDSKGNVNPAKVPYLKDWKSSYSMHGALTEIQKLIQRASRSQPADGTTF